MKIQKFHLYGADLNPHRGTEPGKVRPVVVVQTNLLNDVHPSTLICPITTQVTRGSELLRVHLRPGNPTGLSQESDVLVDQVRAIDNRRFKKEIGHLTESERGRLRENLQILLLE